VNGAIEQNIIRFITNYNLVQKGDKLLIALSGGADSIFMLHFFHKYKSKYRIEISALHINHSLRGDESDKDELFSCEYCKQIGIPFFSETINVKEFAKQNKQSIEEAARNLRYLKLSEYFTKLKLTKIVTAHNLNDNTETMLLNLFRGTGLSGASGIPIVRKNIIRPLLRTSKEDILAYLTKNNIQFRTDKSNFENDFSRNFLRNEIIPKLKEKINISLDINMSKFAEILNESNRIISGLTQNINEKYIKKTDLGLEISDLILLEQGKDFFGVLIKNSIKEKFNIIATFNDIKHLKEIFFLQVGQKIDLSKNLLAIKERNFVQIIKKTETKKKINYANLDLNKEIKIDEKTILASTVNKSEITFSNQKNVEYINGDKIIFPLTIRKWIYGDKFNPIGLNGTKMISDFLTDSKINSSEKKNQLVLLNANKIIWVVNHRIDESVKIKNDTKRVIKLWVK